MKENKNKCCELVHDQFGVGVHRCNKNAKVTVGGKHYCGIHDPAKKEARIKARNERWDAERRQYEEWCKREAETSRRAAIWPELVGLVELWKGWNEERQYSDPRPIRYAQMLEAILNKEQGNGKAE